MKTINFSVLMVVASFYTMLHIGKLLLIIMTEIGNIWMEYIMCFIVNQENNKRNQSFLEK